MRMRTNKRAIDKIYKRRDRYEIPEWQRQEVWSQSKKQNLIDTILRGWKLPKFYFLLTDTNPDNYEVVDGQQRLNAIFEFFDNDLPLAAESAIEFGGEHYKDLQDEASDAFDDYEVEFDVITESSDEDVKLFFQRLQDGLPLTSSEKLNSVHSKLRDFLSKKAKHPFFAKVSVSDKRHGHFDVLAKVAALEVDGIDVGLRFGDLRALFESQSTFSSRSQVAKRLVAALDFAESGFTVEQAGMLRNRTILQSVLTLICRLQASNSFSGEAPLIATFCVDFLKDLAKQVQLGQKATDADYVTYQRTVNANVKTGARIRQEILVRKLLAAHPVLSDAFDAAALAENGIKRAIRERGGELGQLVTEANSKYSASHGDDLFKPTNKTMTAIIRLGKPLVDESEYTTLVDDLYFVFHEGPKGRLQGALPESFSDVNTLRTELRHDVDHGRGGKVRAKKRKAGTVFKKYSGSPSPNGIPPERFPVIQHNLLSALAKDLRAIVDSL